MTSIKKSEVYNFLQGSTAKWLEEKLLRGLREGSIYNYKPLSNVSWNKIKVDNNRFTYSTGESIFYMFAYKARYATIYWKDLPKFHTELCRTRIEFPNFEYGSHMPVNIFCTDQNINLGEQRLRFCRNCNRERNFFRFGNKYDTWDEVIMDIATEKTKIGYQDQEVRSDGYTMDWQHVSYAARSLSNFTCKKCSISLVDNDAFYLEVHHKDYNRRNNFIENLEVLCVDCHANVDDQHIRNFSTGEGRRKLAAFKMKFKRL